MHTIETRIGALSITINVNADWSGDALVKVGRWEPWPAGGGDRYLGGFELPPVAAVDLLAGRPAFKEGGSWPELVLEEWLEAWGAAVAVAVYSNTITSAVAAVEGIKRPGHIERKP